MIDKDDWRLLNDVENLKGKYVNPTDGEEICTNAPYLKRCQFCLDAIKNNPHDSWYIFDDVSCCVCEECFNDFREMFDRKLSDGWDIEWE